MWRSRLYWSCNTTSSRNAASKRINQTSPVLGRACSDGKNPATMLCIYLTEHVLYWPEYLTERHDHQLHRYMWSSASPGADDGASWNPRTCIAALYFIPVQIMRAQQQLPKMQWSRRQLPLDRRHPLPAAHGRSLHQNLIGNTIPPLFLMRMNLLDWSCSIRCGYMSKIIRPKANIELIDCKSQHARAFMLLSSICRLRSVARFTS